MLSGSEAATVANQERGERKESVWGDDWWGPQGRPVPALYSYFRIVVGAVISKGVVFIINEMENLDGRLGVGMMDGGVPHATLFLSVLFSCSAGGTALCLRGLSTNLAGAAWRRLEIYVFQLSMGFVKLS